MPSWPAYCSISSIAELLFLGLSGLQKRSRDKIARRSYAAHPGRLLSLTRLIPPPNLRHTWALYPLQVSHERGEFPRVNEQALDCKNHTCHSGLLNASGGHSTFQGYDVPQYRCRTLDMLLHVEKWQDPCPTRRDDLRWLFVRESDRQADSNRNLIHRCGEILIGQLVQRVGILILDAALRRRRH